MEKTIEQFKEQGFANDQIYEIQEGLKDNLDVSIYAKKEYLAIQMRQIRFGMQQGLAVEKYTDTEFDWFQMEEIRKGLLGGVNVDLYAFPEISYDRMHQIRQGLCGGIDLSPFKMLDAGILKELRLAIEHRISIVPYITAGYDAEQLESIRTAFEKGLDIEPYLKKEYRGISIKEICVGLEHGLDVSVYAKIEYCWQQMREIRLGLEHLVDVEQYSNPYYSWQQMREIRLGLESGLDISYFNSFVYTAADMKRRRILLKENRGIVSSKDDAVGTGSDSTGLCRVILSDDQLEAYFEILSVDKSIGRTDVLKALREKGILYGIMYDEIDRIVKDKLLRKPILVAKGCPAVDGQDGWYEYFFRTEGLGIPKELERGKVDYQNIDWYETVDEGQKLAYYHSATSGENGVTVTGKTILARKGREQNILTGRGIKRLPDKNTYIATKQGIVSINDFNLEVSNVLVMDEVNLATGNVDFDGNVCICGNVRSGTKIRATGDVIVKGFVEAADISCGGSLVLQQGMNASGSGSVKIGKDLVGSFFEATEINADGNISGNYFLNCRIQTSGSINVTGNRGMLAGGSALAEKGLKTYNLGNQAQLATFVKLGNTERILQKEKQLEEAIKSVNRELASLLECHKDFQRKYSAEIRNTMKLYLKIESAIYTKEKELEKLVHEKDSLESRKKNTEHASAVIDNQLYEGVTFEIEGMRWSSKEVKGVIVKKKNNKVTVVSRHI